MNVDVGDVGMVIGEHRREVRQHARAIGQGAQDRVDGHPVNLTGGRGQGIGGSHIIAGTMRRRFVLLAGLIAVVALPALAAAQAPPAMYGTPITADQAKPIAAAAIAAAKKNQWMMAIAIVDPWGELVYFERMDNTQVGSVN